MPVEGVRDISFPSVRLAFCPADSISGRHNSTLEQFGLHTPANPAQQLLAPCKSHCSLDVAYGICMSCDQPLAVSRPIGLPLVLPVKGDFSKEGRTSIRPFLRTMDNGLSQAAHQSRFAAIWNEDKAFIYNTLGIARYATNLDIRVH